MFCFLDSDQNSKPPHRRTDLYHRSSNCVQRSTFMRLWKDTDKQAETDKKRQKTDREPARQADRDRQTNRDIGIDGKGAIERNGQR